MAALGQTDPRYAIVGSLDRAVLGVLNSGDGSKVGRTAARQLWGNGWKEPRASAVLAEAVARWLGAGRVTVVAFYSDNGPLHVVATIGSYAVSGEGISSTEHFFNECCRRYRVAPGSASFRLFDANETWLQFTVNDAVAEQSITHLVALLNRSIDPEVALVVLEQPL